MAEGLLPDRNLLESSKSKASKALFLRQMA